MKEENVKNKLKIMSHFSVLVIDTEGYTDVEDVLAPYHEFECTGHNDEYVQDVDITEECKEHGLDSWGLTNKIVYNFDEIDIDNTHKFGYAILSKDGEIIKAVNRTNPDRKWDWWTEGGRWNNMIPLKTGEMVNSAYLKDIDSAKVRASFSTFAVIVDGNWFEKGEMGWFGLSSATIEDEQKWAENYFDNFIANLPEDAYLTVVDCHI